jgi:hypothetical protein
VKAYLLHGREAPGVVEVRAVLALEARHQAADAGVPRRVQLVQHQVKGRAHYVTPRLAASQDDE